METIYLNGAQDVHRAGSAIQDAARQMANVSSNMQLVLEAHQRFLDDWLLRFEQIMMGKLEGVKD